MKKIRKISVLVVGVLCATIFAGCIAKTTSNSSLEKDEDDKTASSIKSEKENDNQELYMGNWMRYFKVDNYDVTQTMKIYKGGTGKLTIKYTNGNSDSNYDATWELKDGVLNFTYSRVTIGFELSEDGLSLKSVDGEKIFLKVD